MMHSHPGGDPHPKGGNNELILKKYGDTISAKKVVL